VEAFAADLEDAPLRAPARPVPSNRDAEPWPDDPARMRRQLAEQIARPVRFVETL
jgi:malonyl CoA-acyl carrier protein transacylase